MKVYSKHIDWGQVKITKDIMEGCVMPKYGKTNWMKDDSWTDIILDDVFDIFYRDKEAKIEVAKESEDMSLSIMKYDKGKGKEAEHDHLKMIRYAYCCIGSSDLDTLDLENRIKKLKEDFGRLLKAKKAKEAKKSKEVKLAKEAKKEKKEELKANEAKKANEA
ncbi:hypothetical protein Tco_1515339 [Tanacetum coccineum]